MTTLRQIADKAGTTIATVSRALSGSAEISAERKREIRKIAAELGYRRNPHVSTLMRHIQQGRRDLPNKATVALLLTSKLPPAETRKNQVFIHRRFLGMEKRLAERGYEAVTFWYNDPDCQPARLNKILHARGIRGVVLVLFGQSAVNIELDWENLAVATQSNFTLGPSMHRVTEDYFANTVAAMSHLWKSGCRRIGLAYKAIHIPSARFSITAAYRRFAELEGVVDGINARRSPHRIAIHIVPPDEWTEEAFLAWFHREKPDGILTFDWGSIPRWLAKAGVRVPGDVSIAVLNRCPTAPEFSGIDPEPERLGATSVDLVIEQLERNETGLPENSKILTIPGRWVEGRTTNPV